MGQRRLAAVAVLIASLVGLPAAPVAAATRVTCGRVITVDTTLGNDVRNCHAIGLIVAADGVTLDLNGHTIDGDGVSDVEGIQVTGHRDVTIRNGIVRDFVEGVAVLSGRDIVTRDLTLANHRHVGLFIDDSRSVVVENIHATHIAFSAVFVTRSSDVHVTSNVVSDSGGGVALRLTSASSILGNQISRSDCASVYLLDSSNLNVIDGNTIVSDGCEAIAVTAGSVRNLVTHNSVRNAAAGVGIADSDNNVVISNVLRDNRLVGAYVFGSSNGRVDDNVLTGNGDGSEAGIHVLPDGDVASRNNTISRNTILSSVGDGILVDAGSPSTVLDRNAANSNSDDGIDVDEPKTTIRSEQANDNRDFGIEAIAGVIDGGGNTASGNGNPAQCVNVAC
jgi:parallel beta-helix repeat protein